MGGEKRWGEVFYLLVYSPDSDSSHGWASQEPGTPSRSWQEPKSLGHHLLPPTCIRGELNGITGAGLELAFCSGMLAYPDAPQACPRVTLSQTSLSQLFSLILNGHRASPGLHVFVVQNPGVMTQCGSWDSRPGDTHISHRCLGTSTPLSTFSLNLRLGAQAT